MDFIGIDLHKTSSQVCILSGDGELTERRIKSTRDSFDEVFAARRHVSSSKPRPRASGSRSTSNSSGTK
jgi:predicted NBD/HSP70 family sugar kinase